MKAKKVYEALEDILKPPDLNNLDPLNKEIYDAWKLLKDKGYDVNLRSNFYNSNIKEIVNNDDDQVYILSYLPESEKDWTGIIADIWGWGIVNETDGYNVIDTPGLLTKEKAIEIFIDLIENGQSAENNYMQ